MSVTTEDPTVAKAIKPNLKWWSPIDIRDEVCAELGVSLYELLSRRKLKHIVDARHLICLLCAERTRLSCEQIGQLFGQGYGGGRTGINAAEKKAANGDFKFQADRIRKRLNAKL